MGHHSYEESKKKVFMGMILLGVVTLIEVIFSLFGKGHLGWDPHSSGNVTIFGFSFNIIILIVALIIIALSLYKAYFIIFEFMHMKYEAKGLAWTVLLPTTLLIWAVIAFFQEGSEWNNSREQIKTYDERVIDEADAFSGERGETKLINENMMPKDKDE